MGSQPPNYPPPGGYQPGGYQPGGYQPGGYPPGGGGPPGGKTQTFGLDYNVAGLIAYLPCCIGLVASIIFLVTEPKQSKFVRFHSLQSLFLFGVFFVIAVVLAIISGVVLAGAVTAGSAEAGYGMAALFGLIRIGLGLIYLAITIWLCIKAYQNEMWQVPVIGGLADKNS